VHSSQSVHCTEGRAGNWCVQCRDVDPTKQRRRRRLHPVSCRRGKGVTRAGGVRASALAPPPHPTATSTRLTAAIGSSTTAAAATATHGVGVVGIGPDPTARAENPSAFWAFDSDRPDPSTQGAGLRAATGQWARELSPKPLADAPWENFAPGPCTPRPLAGHIFKCQKAKKMGGNNYRKRVSQPGHRRFISTTRSKSSL
jgi:hypothetical protein